MYGQRMRNLSFLFAVAALFTGLNAPLASVASRGPIFDDSGVEAEPVAVANGSQGSARTSPGSCDGALAPAVEPDAAFEVAIGDVELRGNGQLSWTTSVTGASVVSYEICYQSHEELNPLLQSRSEGPDSQERATGPRIVNGDPPVIDEFRYMASLDGCGGTIIAPQ